MAFRPPRAHQRWNGRQIRNAFQIACSLADFEMQKSPLDWDEDEYDSEEIKTENGQTENGQTEKAEKPREAPKLDYTQFQIMDKAIERFDRYLLGAMKGNTDIDYARLSGTRDDDHDTEFDNQGPVYSPRPKPRPQQGRQTTPSMSRSPQQDYNNRPGGGDGGPRRRPPQQSQEYQEVGLQPRARRRPPPSQDENGLLNPRAGVSSASSRRTPRSKVAQEQEYDVGYSGWSTTVVSGRAKGAAVFSNEECDPEGEMGDDQYGKEEHDDDEYAEHVAY